MKGHCIKLTFLIFVLGFSQFLLSQNGTTESHEPVLEFPEKEAVFPGGSEAMVRFIIDNVQYPNEAIENNEQGKVFVSFLVETDGSLTNIRIERGASASLDAEAIRLVTSMPKWTPGELNGKKVRCRCRLPINFTLDGGEPVEKRSGRRKRSSNK